MTGEQIHQELLRLREREKARPKTGPILTKEVTFSSNIGQHDLDTKSKQIQQWIEKKISCSNYHKEEKNAAEPENKMEEIFNQILQTMARISSISTRPQAIKGGTALICVLPFCSERKLCFFEQRKWK
jgi:translation initiation factor IF-3